MHKLPSISTMQLNNTEQTDASLSGVGQSKKLQQLASSSEKVLYRCQTVFPFTLFPDAIVVTPSKVDIVYHHFFFMKSVHSLLIDNILTLRLSTGPFFASIEFEVKGYEQNPPEVTYLPKHSALKTQEIIVGLIAAKQEGVDLKKIKKKQVQTNVNRIGAAKEDVTGL
ncbi:hypothetical protein KBC79_07060 [Candidatus Woesebacteria bacterium]|nr:hypothetical protein [Candidatus Woesebacteria bacterium]